MPLNFKESDQEQQDDDGVLGPILPDPGEEKKVAPKMIIVVLSVVVLLAAIFLIYKYALHKGQQLPAGPATTTKQIEQPKPAPATGENASQNTPPASGQIAATSDAPPVPAAKSAAIENASKGNFTIYISRHKTQAVADEETGRWKDAGYDSRVTLVDGWYCVAVGRYETSAEAKEEAEKLSDGFEAGYKVGIVRE